ncbi:MAG: DUF5522 domain-containing protein [archaeon]|nr:DUF5522 domain-containing protein [archaeon]
MQFEPLSKELLLAQGACCGSGCKNCPFSPKHLKGATKVE